MHRSSNTKPIYWINAAKAICMIFVYWVHSEIYSPIYGHFSLIPLFETFYVNAFFIVSGYLFFRSINGQILQKEYIFYRLNNIFFRLFIPTIVFPSLLFIPKFLFHSNDISFFSYAYNVLGGISAWFTSALTVTQIMMILLCFFIPQQVFLYSLISFILLILVVLINDFFPSPFPWYWKSGLAGCFLFSLGGLYHKYEKLLDHFNVYMVLGEVGVILFIAGFGVFSPVWTMMSCRFSFSGFFLMVSSSLFLIQITKIMPTIPALDYIGKHSILFYFFSCALPALLGTFWIKFLPGTSCYLLIIVELCIEIPLAFLISICINRFAPFMVDARKLLIKK